MLDEVDARGGDVCFTTGEDSVELIDGGDGVFVGNFESGGEVNLLAVALEAVGGDAAAEAGPDFLLGLFVGFGVEDLVDEIELLAGERGELGEGLEWFAAAGS